MALLFSACGGEDSAEGGSSQNSDTDQADAQQETASESSARETHESQGPSPRLGITYDGGVLVVDAMTLEVVDEFAAEGFTRLNPAGDGRHMLLTEGSAFRVLDAGVWSEPHGNHDHSYTTEPALTDMSFEADHPGHVVNHAGQTVLFADGTGTITLFDPQELSEGEAPEIQEEMTPEAHHGVAVQLEDGSLLHTIGDEETRSGATVLAADGAEAARSEECPGVHGETAAAEETILLGCEDGVLIYRDGEFTKVDAEEDYTRIGNVAGSDESPVVLGDHKTDPDAEVERPTTVSLVDTQAAEITTVDLPASYSFRSLGRGPEEEALVLGTDGVLRSIDETSGDITEETPVVSEWEEPMDWQQPRPTLLVMGSLAYVTEPASRQLHIVDLETDEVIDSTELPHAPNELSGVTG